MHSWLKQILVTINENEKIKKKLNIIWTKTQQIFNKELQKKLTDNSNVTNIKFLGFCFIPVE